MTYFVLAAIIIAALIVVAIKHHWRLAKIETDTRTLEQRLVGLAAKKAKQSQLGIEPPAVETAP